MALEDSFSNIPEERAGTLAMMPLFGKQTFGYYQYLKGIKDKKGLVRPEYEIPEEIRQNLSQAQLLAIEGLPAEQKRQYIENIQRSMTANLSALTGRKAGLVGVSGLAQAEADAYKDLLGLDVAARTANQQKLMEQRAIMGDQKALRWQINMMLPYLQKYGEAQGLIGSGAQNMSTGTSEMAKLSMDALGQVAGAAIAASDIRLKKNISFLGKNRGINIYTFNYLWSDELSVGVMAQEIEKSHPESVLEFNGYKAVDYSKLF